MPALLDQVSQKAVGKGVAEVMRGKWPPVAIQSLANYATAIVSGILLKQSGRVCSDLKQRVAALFHADPIRTAVCLVAVAVRYGLQLLQ
ncbi:hypothetical protein [Pseudomonas fluorescens]|uniref:hypothetical protein n=1 Tax=Pseudomonas fluorescens TaxID=294 RepID=UPI00163B5848|nr:hypothetical protein [Pseudomonas fluorescens]